MAEQISESQENKNSRAELKALSREVEDQEVLNMADNVFLKSFMAQINQERQEGKLSDEELVFKIMGLEKIGSSAALKQQREQWKDSMLLNTPDLQQLYDAAVIYTNIVRRKSSEQGFSAFVRDFRDFQRRFRQQSASLKKETVVTVESWIKLIESKIEEKTPNPPIETDIEELRQSILRASTHEALNTLETRLSDVKKQLEEPRNTLDEQQRESLKSELRDIQLTIHRARVRLYNQ